MSRFNDAVVTAVQQDTLNAKVITIDCPDFQGAEFKPGQYITVRFELNDQDFRRSYSVCNLPENGQYKIGVKRLPDGVVSGHMHDNLSPGNAVEIMAPEGNFVIRESENEAHHIFFAAGSGITPVMSMIEHIVLNGKDRATLFYGNRSASETMFKSRLDELNLEGKVDVVNILSDGSGPSALERGRIDFSKTLELLKAHADGGLNKVYYMCGPSGMMSAVENALTVSGVSTSDIVKEHFVNPDQDLGEQHVPLEEPAGDFSGEAKVKVTLDGEEHEFPLSTNGKVMLDAVFDAGLDAPFSCKGGVCTTCRAQVVSGRVNMDSNYALTEEEIEEGVILTCQSHPCTENVEITYDI